MHWDPQAGWSASVVKGLDKPVYLFKWIRLSLAFVFIQAVGSAQVSAHREHRAALSGPHGLPLFITLSPTRGMPRLFPPMARSSEPYVCTYEFCGSLLTHWSPQPPWHICGRWGKQVEKKTQGRLFTQTSLKEARYGEQILTGKGCVSCDIEQDDLFFELRWVIKMPKSTEWKSNIIAELRETTLNVRTWKHKPTYI